MNPTETAHVFACAGEQLVGVLSRPAQPGDTAVLVIVGGPQYRVGSHRQFVALGRALAAAGVAALRFDYRGMGDAGGALRSFESVDEDIAAALALLQRELPGLRQVALWGLCDGASAALMYCQRRRDPLVRGVVALNPWVRSAQTLARTQVKHYYRQRLMQPDFWRKLLSGRVAGSALRSLLHNLRAARGGAGPADADAPRSYQDRMAEAWRDTGRPLLLILSGKDYTAKEFLEATQTDPAWQGALLRPGLEQHTLADANHTFSEPAHQLQVEAITCRWLRTALQPQPLQPAGGP